MSIHPDNSRSLDPRFLVYVLVPMDHHSRRCSLNVGCQAVESVVNLILPLMNSPWGVVGKKNLNGRKNGKNPLDFCLFI